MTTYRQTRRQAAQRAQLRSRIVGTLSYSLLAAMLGVCAFVMGAAGCHMGAGALDPNMTRCVDMLCASAFILGGTAIAARTFALQFAFKAGR